MNKQSLGFVWGHAPKYLEEKTMAKIKAEHVICTSKYPWDEISRWRDRKINEETCVDTESPKIIHTDLYSKFLQR